MLLQIFFNKQIIIISTITRIINNETNKVKVQMNEIKIKNCQAKIDVVKRMGCPHRGPM